MKTTKKTIVSLLIVLLVKLSFAQTAPIKIEGDFTSEKATREFEEIIGEIGGNYISVEKMNPKAISFHLIRKLSIRLINKKTLKVVKEKYFDDILYYSTKEGEGKYIFGGAWLSEDVVKVVLQEIESGKVTINNINPKSLQLDTKGELLCYLNTDYDTDIGKKHPLKEETKRLVYVGATSPKGTKAFITASHLSEKTLKIKYRKIKTFEIDKSQTFLYDSKNGIEVVENKIDRFINGAKWLNEEQRFAVALPMSKGEEGAVYLYENEEIIKETKLTIKNATENDHYASAFGSRLKIVGEKLIITAFNRKKNWLISGVVDLGNLTDVELNLTLFDNELIAGFWAEKEKDVKKIAKRVEQGKINSIGLRTNISDVALSSEGHIYFTLNAQTEDRNFNSTTKDWETERLDKNMVIAKIDENGKMLWYKNLWYKFNVLSLETFSFLNNAPFIVGDQVCFLINGKIKKIEGQDLEIIKGGNSDCTLVTISQDGKSWTKSNLTVPKSIEDCIIKTTYVYFDNDALIVPLKTSYSNVGYARITFK